MVGIPFSRDFREESSRVNFIRMRPVVVKLLGVEVIRLEGCRSPARIF